MQLEREGRRRWGYVGFVVTVLFTACGEDNNQSRGADTDSGLAELILELSLGEDESAPPEYQFAEILSLVPGPDGKLWVLDGATVGMTGQTPLLRQFDSTGNFLREVGREGPGPGEYRAPFALGLGRDGRVAVRDYAFPGRITWYTASGELSETWSLGRSIYSVFVPSNIDVDTAGVMWLDFRGSIRDRDAPSGILRVRPGGTILDTITPPPAPKVEREVLRVVRTTPSGGTSTRGFTIPYQPRGARAWSPTGEYALARTDQYRIEVYPGPGHSDADRFAEEGRPDPAPRVISRDLAPVPVPEPERAAARQRLEEQVRAYDPSGGLSIPEIPAYKPPIKDMRFGHGGRLWVGVSMPSRLEEDEWSEPTAYDVFDTTGEFLGRIVLPDSFRARWLEGDQLWGTYTGPFEVESIRRYRIVWPSGTEND